MRPRHRLNSAFATFGNRAIISSTSRVSILSRTPVEGSPTGIRPRLFAMVLDAVEMPGRGGILEDLPHAVTDLIPGNLIFLLVHARKIRLLHLDDDNGLAAGRADAEIDRRLPCALTDEDT